MVFNFLAGQSASEATQNWFLTFCFLFLLLVNGFEIYMVFFSFKHGTSFLNHTIIDEKGRINWIFFSAFSVLALGFLAFAIIYLLDFIGIASLLNANLEKEVIGFIISTFTLFGMDCLLAIIYGFVFGGNRRYDDFL
jgi:heme/copper-type cytochrome/quinol oxidase subunit 2